MLSLRKSLMPRRSSCWGCKTMVTIPNNLVESVKTIIDWHLDTYKPEFEFNVRLERILEHFFERNMIEGTVQVDENELYYIYECVSDATNHTAECGVGKSLVWETYDWIRAERNKAKR